MLRNDGEQSMNVIRKIKDLVEPMYNAIRDGCVHGFYYLPVKKNKIVFIQGCGEGYRCNLKYIAEEIHRQNLPYDLVWMVKSYDIDIPSFIRKVKYNRIRAVYELATAHIMINNSKSLYPVKKKATQKFIYIPHGQPGCKCAEGDAVLSEEWVRNSKIHSSLTDIFVSMGTYHTQVLKETFWVPQNADIWEIGFPRNDQYYQDTITKQNEIRKKLSIPNDTKVVLYAPTYRDNGTVEAYNLDFERVLQVLKKKTNCQWLLFVTLHPCFAWFKHPPYVFGKSVWNMSDYPDIHELLLIVDAVISDYSSIALDFSNTRKPVFLYASDLKEYSLMRGLKQMYYHLPFLMSTNNNEMENAIMGFDAEKYANQLQSFYKTYGSVDDGHASERFVSKLKLLV